MPERMQLLPILVLLLSWGVTLSAAEPPRFHLMEAGIEDIHSAFKSGRFTCRDLTQLYLKRIAAYNKSGPMLNAVLTLNPEALRDADALDAVWKASGPVGPLHCIPVLIKDQVETKGLTTTYGSAVFQTYVPNRDATVVLKLKRAGALILGKTTMGEYASGYAGSAFGVIRNAYDPTRSPSGSSGGTGSAITANFAAVGIGEDTGGSIRGPAAVSSLVGLRPTVPLVSRYGMLPAKPSSDTLGPIARTVTDAAIVLGVIAGYDPNDAVTAYAVGQVPDSYTSFLRRDGLKGARIGIIREPMDPKADPSSADYKQVRTVIDQAIGDLKAQGAELVDPVVIPGVQERVTKLFDGNEFETEGALNSYLAGLPNAPVKTLDEIILSGKAVPYRAAQLMKAASRSTGDAGYLEILRLREETRLLVLKIMADKRLDALAYATFDRQPGQIAPDILSDRNPKDLAGLGNNRKLSPVTGFPAITVPAGFTADALPVGLEFLARPFAEGTLLKLGYAYEQATHRRRIPPTTPALPGEP
jgi:Asp-tRNA(Asn)/Glu-tRNA(Gln) amidotransferase A subunit family amidase